ncbi:MAG: hypothetical protein M1836_006807 [Candelina mexicana]|nr:MAG: hypothetical protein M1836_006807 [Candelina mexicana]
MSLIFPFLQLPGEIRNKIYDYVLHWDISPLEPNRDRRLTINYVEKLRCFRPRERGILLANRQIHSEAAYILYNIRMSFIIPFRCSTTLLGAFPRYDLQAWRKVRFDIDMKELDTTQRIFHHMSWGNLIRDLAHIWEEKNGLESLQITFRDSPVYGPAARGRDDEDGEWKLQRETLGNLLQLRGIKKVTIEGDIMESFAHELKTRMESSE